MKITSESNFLIYLLSVTYLSQMSDFGNISAFSLARRISSDNIHVCQNLRVSNKSYVEKFCIFFPFSKLMYLCRFLSMLEEEVYGASSPIWDPDFSQNAANMAGSPPTTRRLCCKTLDFSGDLIFARLLLSIYSCDIISVSNEFLFILSLSENNW